MSRRRGEGGVERQERMRKFNLHKTEFPERKGGGVIFEKTIAEDLPELMKNINPQNKEAQKICKHKK